MSAFTAAASIPMPATAVQFITTVASLPGLDAEGLAVARRPRVSRRSEDDLRTIAEEEAQTLQTLAALAREHGCADRRAQRRRHADARGIRSNRKGSPSIAPATTSTSIARRSALGAATLDDCALTVLATRGQQAGGGPDHSRLRQQDAAARRRARILATAGPRRGLSRHRATARTAAGCTT